jgi:FAD/FMN-containing dehydrogenase
MSGSVTSGTPTVPELRAALAGGVIAPGDPRYDEARTPFYGGIDRHPAAIARVANADDVARTVTFARERGIELAVRSGGHSIAGHCVSEGGLVIDLADLSALDLDPEGRTAWAETGVTAGAYTVAAAEHGLATGFGDTGSVGIGGITLGGGVGFLVRKHGLTIDSLLAADVVTADGELVRADAESHPDLFWAIRGGGGNFGVATRLHFRLHEVPTVVGGILILPATSEVIASFLAEADAAPDELSTIANVMPAPPMPFVAPEHHGKLVLLAFMTYAGDVEAGERAVAPFRALATPIADLLRPMSYPEMYMPEEGEFHPIGTVRSMFVDEIGPKRADAILEHLEASTAMMRVAQLRVLGGAMARVPADATAFAHRSSRIMVNVAALFERPEESATHEAWVTGLADALRGDDRGVYVGFLGDEGAGRVRDAYPGPTWDRLAEIKRRYDPTNLFHLNQNVPPAGGGA